MRFLITACLLMSPFMMRSVIGNDAQPPVELFAAESSGDVRIEFIALDSVNANVLVHNQTGKEIEVQLPQVFGAKPILAQIGQMGIQQGFGQQGVGQQGFGQAGFGQAGGQNGASQQVGGAFGQGGIGGNQMGRAAGNQFGGVMRIAPNKKRKIVATTVCLEHGKRDPSPKLAYKMVPLVEVTRNQTIRQALVAMGQDEITQKVAQAIAWNKANDLPWKKLAKLNRINSRYLGVIKLFNKTEISDAKSFVANHDVDIENSQSADLAIPDLARSESEASY